jgi:hypothetical protein
MSDTENAAAEEAKETADRNAGDDSDVEQDAGVGPMEGDEAIDDDTEFTHTPISPVR